MLCLCHPVTFATSKYSKAKAEADAHVPKGAVLVAHKSKGKFYEFRYEKGQIDYTITINPKYQLQAKTTKRNDMNGGASYKISQSEAMAKVTTTYSPSKIISCTKYKQQGCHYVIAFQGKNYVGYVKINATNLFIVKSSKVYYRKGAGLIKPTTALKKMNSKVKNGKITSFELNYNSKKKRFDFEIAAIKGQNAYKLTLNAKTGKATAFEQNRIK